MEARFIVLHPDDPGEILSATALLRCLKSQVEESFVYSVVKEDHSWLLDSNPWLDEVFTYQENPKELLEQLKDFLPDYLIDLDGSRHVRRFKNRLKVLDFTLNRRNIGDEWPVRVFNTCTLFDVQDDGKGPQFEADQSYKELIPGNFLDGFLALSLDSTHHTRQITDDQIIEMVVRTEKPIVVTGTVHDRKLADRISQSTGCAVFPTCGDFSKRETASVLCHSKGAVVFDPMWSLIATSAGIKNVIINEKTDLAHLTEIALWGRSLFQSGHERHTL